MLDSPFLSIDDWPFKEKPSSLEWASASTALQFPIEQQTGRLTSVKLLIRVVAPDFSIEGASEKTLDVPPDRNSESLSFLLKTQRRGACRINVEAYTLAREYVGTIPVTTSVNGGSTQQLATVASLIVVIIAPHGNRAQVSTLPSASSGRQPRRKSDDSVPTPIGEPAAPIPAVTPKRSFRALIAVALIFVLAAVIGTQYPLQMGERRRMSLTSMIDEPSFLKVRSAIAAWWGGLDDDTRWEQIDLISQWAGKHGVSVEALKIKGKVQPDGFEKWLNSLTYNEANKLLLADIVRNTHGLKLPE